MFKNLNTSVLGVSGNQSEIIELALTHGFKAMDLDMVDFANRAKLHGMPYARRLIDSSKLTIATFDLPFGLDSPEDAFQKDLQRLSGLASTAAELGCTRCLTMLAPAGDKLPYHENFELHRARLGAIGKVLAPLGIRLGVGFRAASELRVGKTFQFVHELDALGLLLSMAGVSNLGVVLDVWDLVVSGGSVVNARGMAADQIVAVQLADAPAETPLAELTEKSRLLPGTTGRIDVPAFLIALGEMGYRGPVTAKPHKSIFSGSRRDLIARKTAEALDGVWKTAGLTAQGKLGAPVLVPAGVDAGTAGE
jgi:sugar phosphate isomerase/epimerase